MNRDSLYTFVTSLLDDFEIDLTLFYTLLDVAQSNRENARPWVILRTEDSTQSAVSGETFESQHSLPTDFRKFYSRFPIVLTDSSGNVVRKLREVPINMRHEHKDDPSKFYVNYVTRKIYLCGTQTTTSTLRQFYIRKPTKISASASNTWDFSAYDDYEKILAFDVAVMHKHGIDYDQINAVQGDKNAAQAALIFSMMSEWDNELANSAQQGVDYGSSPISGFSEYSGNSRDLIGG